MTTEIEEITVMFSFQHCLRVEAKEIIVKKSIAARVITAKQKTVCVYYYYTFNLDL
jgi:hypothetical protein